MQPQAAQAPAQPAGPPNDKADLDAILARLEKSRKRPAIVYWTTLFARVSIGVELTLFDQLQALGSKQPALDLVLCTSGGESEAPIRIVSLIREYCDQLSILLPHRALSAGTVIAMGADEIVMTPLSVLGPIDPSRTHPLLPRSQGAKEAEPISVQDMRHAMHFIRESVPSDVAYTPEAMAQIFSALFDKIHPLAIGAIEQSYALAKLVGKRCLETHMDPVKQERQINAIVDRLCDDFKSHSYQVSRREAKAIGLKAVDATPAIEAVLNDLMKFYTARAVGPFPGPPHTPGQQVKAHIAWLDSLRAKFRAEQQFVIGPALELQNQGDSWLPY